MKIILKNLRWILLPFSISLLLAFIEAATDAYGIEFEEDDLMYATWIVVIPNICLFIFKNKWNKLVDRWF